MMTDTEKERQNGMASPAGGCGRRSGEPMAEATSGFRELGAEERRLIKVIVGKQERLKYPTHPMVMSNGKAVEVYDIPDEDRAGVLEKLYIFEPLPKLDDVYYDLHEERTFTIRDYMVTYEDECNYLVSPYYPLSGGTVLDWIPQEEVPDLDWKLVTCRSVRDERKSPCESQDE